MAKINVTVELDWMDEEYDLDHEIKQAIIANIVDGVKNKVLEQAESECAKMMNQQMADISKTVSQKLNGIMESFFDEPHDVTDKWGDVIKKNVTVRDTLKEACTVFMEQPLDESGNPVSKGSYNAKYENRVAYVVAKMMNRDMEYTIKNTVESITKNLKEKISSEIKQQMGDKLANVLDLNKML